MSYESVRRRQLARMKKRSHWFLGPSQRHSHDAVFISREISVEKTSLDGLSSEGLLTESDAERLSDQPESSRLSDQPESLRLSDTGSSLVDDHKAGPSETESTRHKDPQIVNGSNGAVDSSCQQGASAEERDVKCFMVEHYYGADGSGAES